MILEEKHILLGITGGIAAYKAVGLASSLTQAGALVDVVMTEAATKLVAPLTFQSITGRPVAWDMWAPVPTMEIEHVSLAKRAEVVVVAPATANTIAKMARGVADNLLTTALLSTEAPMVIAPSMETGMWEHPATQDNVSVLAERGAAVVGPGEGRLASGRWGKGRLADEDEILGTIRMVLGRGGVLGGKHLVVTAGGTRESLDPVRFLGNRSLGKMGYALAQAAIDLGARVTLVSGPTALKPPVGCASIGVETASEMLDAVLNAVDEADALIMAAAVADYRPENTSESKMKKTNRNLNLNLVRTTDILERVTARRDEGRNPGLVVGFAAETEDLVANAEEKMRNKALDLVVANDVSAADSGFEVDTNRVVLLDRGGNTEELPLLPKAEVAERILDWVGKELGGEDGSDG
jgi:phosphopantothenoylcysteine decarboxylase/phosphopantothenate--cysteine ligase